VTKIICGVDISKRRLDAHVEPLGAFKSFNNDAAGIAELATFCHRQGVELVVMEATGGYERAAFLLLWEAGIACGLTNPRSVRRYAEAMGVLEKTDRLDARVIARFAIAKDLRSTEPPTAGQQRLTALVARLRQVTDDLVVQKQRRSSAMNPEMVASIDEVIALLKRQTRTLEAEVAGLIDDDPLWSCLDAALRTKGLANRAVARLLAELPEIGIYSNKAVAAHPRRSSRHPLDPVFDRRHRPSLRREPWRLPSQAHCRRQTKDGRAHRTGSQTPRPAQRKSTRSARALCACNLTTQVVALPLWGLCTSMSDCTKTKSAAQKPI
jgi:transposase